MAGSSNSGRQVPFVKQDDYVVVYTDGSYFPNENRAGIGVYFNDDHPWNVSEPIRDERRITNMVAEFKACIRAVQIAKDWGIEKLKIRTDSECVINTMELWIKKWMANGWINEQGEQVQNRELIQQLHRLCSTITDVEWEYVEAHSGDVGNKNADKLAKAGARM